MDYEKAYEDALERAKSAIKECGDNKGRITMIESIFPELKESEDERIRKALLNEFIHLQSKGYKFAGLEGEEIVAWLEKQDDYNRLVEEIKKRKELLSKEKEKAASTNDKLSLGGRIAMLEELLAFTKEKQGEQKSVDKVKPKFKIGDTVTVKPMSCHGKVFKGEPFKIVDIIEDNYVSDGGKTYSISLQDGWELVEQNSTWSEEDEEMLKEIVSVLEGNNVFTTKMLCEYANWLKSLKERMKGE